MATLTQFVSTTDPVSTNFIKSSSVDTLSFLSLSTPVSSFLITDNIYSSAPSWEGFLSTWENAIANWETLS